MAAVKNVVAGAVLRQVRSLFSASASSHFTTVPIARKIHTREVKKFYKNARIAQSNGLFEINLDKRKLRTPLGNLFQVDNESLALAVATEWNAQEDTIKQHNMYLTTLCNTVIDNPMQRTKEDLTKAVLHFLETDTLCYRMLDPPDLITFQQTHWDPLVDWFRSR
ncbi:ATPeAF2 [Acanthosepion pharaonis]|uniref:ATPeAF2 n=1 Tax=Acanthosepion pharaonis TaxID=158019 RepID=A0A812CQK5_ACAPH|nr:ATPeAF2 [Sepia pharaonis]